MVNSGRLQTDGAFMGQRWMQRVQSWNTLWSRFKFFVFFFSVLPQSEHHLPIKQDNNQTTNKGPANVSSPDCLSTAGQSLR